MKTKTIVIALLAIMALSLAPAAYAADNGTEFGIEDDLSVLGSTGTFADPDLEVKGFSVVGALAGPQNIAAAPGNMVLRGNLQADATAYFGSSVTVAGYGLFTSTVQVAEGNLKYGTAVSGKVLKSGGAGYVYWGDDDTGAAGLAGTPYRIRMENAAGTTLADSLLLQNSLSSNITLTGNSSMTVTGAFEAGGDSIFNSTVTLTEGNMKYGAGAAGKVMKSGGNGFVYWADDTAGLTVLGNPYRLQMVNGAGTGLADTMFQQNVGATNITMLVGSSFTVHSDMWVGAMATVSSATVINSLTVNGDSQLGDSVSDKHGINRAAETGVGLSVDSPGASGSYAAKFYSNNSLAAWIKKK